MIAQLIREGRVDRAFIGLSATPITRRPRPRLPAAGHAGAARAERRSPGSGAAKAGLKAGTTQVVLAGETYDLGGDIIVAAGGSPVSSLNRLRDIVAAKKPGDNLGIVVYRGNSKHRPRSEARTATGHGSAG